MKLSKNEILELLPHRDPMQMLDEVIEVEPLKSIVATHYFDPEWPIFKGHFPGDPVVPGVLSCEMLGQAHDVMIMTCDEYKGLEPLFAGLNNVRFYKKLEPGMTCRVESEIIKARPEKKLFIASGKIFVDDELAVEGETVVAMR